MKSNDDDDSAGCLLVAVGIFVFTCIIGGLTIVFGGDVDKPIYDEYGGEGSVSDQITTAFIFVVIAGVIYLWNFYQKNKNS